MLPCLRTIELLKRGLIRTIFCLARRTFTFIDGSPSLSSTFDMHLEAFCRRTVTNLVSTSCTASGESALRDRSVVYSMCCRVQYIFQQLWGPRHWFLQKQKQVEYYPSLYGSFVDSTYTRKVICCALYNCHGLIMELLHFLLDAFANNLHVSGGWRDPYEVCRPRLQLCRRKRGQQDVANSMIS